MERLGKNQSFSREYNNLLVLRMIQKDSLAATEMSERLSLSNATLSSILRSFLKLGVIKIGNTASLKGIGRKRVYYELNENYGLVLCVNISNFHVVISLSNIKQEVIKSIDIEIEKYDSKSIYKIILEATKLLYGDNQSGAPLKQIIVSLPGRVNTKTGDLVLSKQFEKELFSKSHFIQSAFAQQFPDVPIIITNDINISALAEQQNGYLKNIQNACYVSVDYGIGGSFIINNEVFGGNQGYAGEFGLIKFYDGEKYEYIDEFISLRSLACSLFGVNNPSKDDIEKVFELYNNDKEVKDKILKTASILGRSLRNVMDVCDISTFIIRGRVKRFGKDYLDTINKQFEGMIYSPTIKFASLDSRSEIIGATYFGVENIILDAARRATSEE